MLERAVSKDRVDTIRYFERDVAEPPANWTDIGWAGRCIDILKYFTAEAAQFIEPGYLDWVYIDANHAYQAALNDLRDYGLKVKPGGYVMLHDFQPVHGFGVDKAISQFLAEQPDFILMGISGEKDWGTAVLRRAV